MFISWFWYLYLGYINLPTSGIGRRAYVNSLSYSCNFPSVQNYLKIKHVCFKVLNHGPQRIQREDWVTVMGTPEKGPLAATVDQKHLIGFALHSFKGFHSLLFTYSLVSIRWNHRSALRVGQLLCFILWMFSTALKLPRLWRALI